MKKDWAIVILIALLFLCILRSYYLERRVSFLPSYPREGQAAIVQVNGYDFKVAWWLWGPHRIENLNREYRIPKRILRQLIKTNICEGS